MKNRADSAKPFCLAFALYALVLCGCGDVGEPLPPALHIPDRVHNLSAVQRGGDIIAHFTLPTHTTENLTILKPIEIDLRAGPAPSPFNAGQWQEQARSFADVPSDKPNVEYAFSGAEWIGKDIVIGVRISGENGRTAGWSDFVTLSVVPALAAPADLVVKAVTEGIELSWSSSAPNYRIYRQSGQESNSAAVAETETNHYIDKTTVYGTSYRYSVEAFRSGGDIRAVSMRTPEVEITPQDVFPPPVPTGFAVVVSTGSIELAWDRNPAPDFAGYRIYRADDSGRLEKLAETREAPSYSDRKVQSGKTYRYAVTAFDRRNNESQPSVTLTATAQ